MTRKTGSYGDKEYVEIGSSPLPVHNFICKEKLILKDFLHNYQVLIRRAHTCIEFRQLRHSCSSGASFKRYLGKGPAARLSEEEEFETYWHKSFILQRAQSSRSCRSHMSSSCYRFLTTEISSTRGTYRKGCPGV